MNTQTMVKIDKDIPIPDDSSRGRNPKYPWRNMKKGDSFFVPQTTTARFASGAFGAGRALNMKFSLRKENDGVRVWRVK